jgi:hypothetical protein
LLCPVLSSHSPVHVHSFRNEIHSLHNPIRALDPLREKMKAKLYESKYMVTEVNLHSKVCYQVTSFISELQVCPCNRTLLVYGFS